MAAPRQHRGRHAGVRVPRIRGSPHGHHRYSRMFARPAIAPPKATNKLPFRFPACGGVNVRVTSINHPVRGVTVVMGSTGVIYRLLGELEIGENGRLVEPPTGPTLLLLAGLLVQANRTIAEPAVIGAAWGHEAPAAAQLHKRVMAVRDLLAEIARRHHVKTRPRIGYELRAA